MAYERKGFDSLFGILDTLVYEAGRLAIVEKYGHALEGAEKAKVEDLISRQKENVNKLCEIYKNELTPIMSSLHSIGESLDDYTRRLVSAIDTYDKPNFAQHGVDSEAPAEITDDVSVAPQAAVVDEKNKKMPSVSETTAIPEEVSAQQGVVTDSEIVPDLADSTNMAAVTLNTNVDNTAPVVQAESIGANVETPANDFVLSPIEDGVLPAPTEEKQEGVGDVGVDSKQQSQTIANANQEITNAPGLTLEEKTGTLEKYTRASQGAVKAILVTGEQLRKLGDSRSSQKALLNAKDSGADLNASISQLQTEERALEDGKLLDSSVQDSKKEMELMMAQANELYKAGKIQAAQELYNKVSAMNKVIQAGSSASELVKK